MTRTKNQIKDKKPITGIINLTGFFFGEIRIFIFLFFYTVFIDKNTIKYNN